MQIHTLDAIKLVRIFPTPLGFSTKGKSNQAIDKHYLKFQDSKTFTTATDGFK